jgi:hypothetical protein
MVYSIGPVAQYHENSMYYSAVKPEPNPEIDNNLPHITIQLPVYKESLELTMYVRSPSVPAYAELPLAALLSFLSKRLCKHTPDKVSTL